MTDPAGPGPGSDEVALAALQRDWPAWRIWVHHRPYGPAWCAHRHDDRHRVLSAASPGELAGYLMGAWLAGGPGDRTAAAVGVLRAGLHAEADFPGWAARVLTRLAAAEGSSAALTAGRPGSWEAALVRQLVAGYAGEEDEDLSHWR